MQTRARSRSRRLVVAGAFVGAGLGAVATPAAATTPPDSTSPGATTDPAPTVPATSEPPSTTPASASITPASPAPEATPTAAGTTFRHVGTFEVLGNLLAGEDPLATPTVAEIVAATAAGDRLVYTDALTGRIGVVDISDPGAPAAVGALDVGGDPTSVVVAGGSALAVVNTSTDFVDTSGQLVVVDLATLEITATFELAGQPDSIALSPDGTLAAVVIENERDEELGDGLIPQAPAGLLQIVDLPGGDAAAIAAPFRDVDLTGMADVAPDDPEPEFVDINEANQAVLSLQENNHLAVIDLASGEITNDFSAGSVALTGADTVGDGLIQFTDDIERRREPDAVTWIDEDRFAVANEGDYVDADGVEGGSRSFTIFNTDGTVEYESGLSFEYALARVGQYPEHRSDAKGVEPEGVEFGVFDGTPLLFVGSERGNGVGVYDVTDPTAPAFVQVLPTGVGPEGIRALPERGLLAVSAEVDGLDEAPEDQFPIRALVTVYELGAPTYPMLESVDDPNPPTEPATVPEEEAAPTTTAATTEPTTAATAGTTEPTGASTTAPASTAPAVTPATTAAANGFAAPATTEPTDTTESTAAAATSAATTPVTTDAGVETTVAVTTEPAETTAEPGSAATPAPVLAPPIPWAALSGLAPDLTDPAMLWAVSDRAFALGFLYRIDTSTTPARIVERLPVGEPGAGLDLEGVAVRPDGGFWVVSEGDGESTVNELWALDASGAPTGEPIVLPDELAATATNNGFEGVEVTVEEGTEVVYVAVQRPWEGDAEDLTRIGRYDVAAGEWTFAGYRLDPVESPNGGWVGLSDLSVTADGQLAVVERDNQLGGQARIKRVYAVDPSAVTFVPAGQELPVLDKTLLVDLLPVLDAASISVPDKVEGLAPNAAGGWWVVTDNDGTDENYGETVFVTVS